LTPKARQALIEAQTIVGYTAYIGLIDDELLQDKEIISTGMTGEILIVDSKAQSITPLDTSCADLSWAPLSKELPK